MSETEEPDTMTYIKAASFSAFLSAASIFAIQYLKENDTSPDESIIPKETLSGVKQDRILTGDFDA